MEVVLLRVETKGFKKTKGLKKYNHYFLSKVPGPGYYDLSRTNFR